MNDVTPHQWYRAIWSNRKARFGILLTTFFLTIALVGPLLVGDPIAFIGIPHQPPSATHWFGTTGQGQDVFTQVVAGTRITLMISFATGFLVVCIGAFIGGAAGYFGGFIDDILSLFINIFLVLPGLPLMVVIAAWVPTGRVTMTLVLVVTGWAWGARVIRSQVMVLRQRDFVTSAIVLGEPAWRIIVIEILPNMASLLVSSFIGATVYAVGAQVGLEYLGLGDLTSVTWGTNLYWASNDQALLTHSWWMFVPTGLCIALLGFGLTLINYGVDEVTNPKLRDQSHRDSPMAPTPVVILD